MAAREDVDFQSSVEAMFVQALGTRLTPRLREQLKACGINLDAPLAPAYPRRVFARGCVLAAEELYPELPHPERMRLLGRDYIGGYTRTFMGKALFRMLGLIGMERVLGRLTRSFRSGDNYTDCSMRMLGERRAELSFNQVNDAPTFTQGILEGGLEAVGARQLQVRILRREGEGAVFEVQWGSEERSAAAG